MVWKDKLIETRFEAEQGEELRLCTFGEKKKRHF